MAVVAIYSSNSSLLRSASVSSIPNSDSTILTLRRSVVLSVYNCAWQVV